MEKYPKYKDSGVNWIGDVPEHWEIKRIGAFYIDNNNKNSALEFTEAYKFNYGTLVRKDEDVKLEEVADVYSKYTVISKNDIIFNGLNLNYDFVSQRVAKADKKGIITSAYVAITPRENVLTDYFIYLFKSMDDKKLFHGMGTGIRLTLGYNELKKQLIPIPPLSEQHAIVSFLEKETSQIDSYIKLKEQEVERLNELKQAEIAHVVTKGLNPNVKMKDSGIAWIGEVPEHWEVKRIGAFYIDNNNKNSALEFTEAYKFNYGTLVRKDEGIKLEEVADVYSKYTIISKNDIIINGLNLNYDFISQRVAKVDKKGIITSAYVAITPREDVFTDYFIYLFKSMDDKKLFHGMGTGIRLTLGYNELKKQLIPIPPLSEQQQIASYIETKVNQIDTYISITKREIEQMQEYKQRLISDAVTGKIKV